MHKGSTCLVCKDEEGLVLGRQAPVVLFTIHLSDDILAT
jgi:hypothetical protein